MHKDQLDGLKWGEGEMRGFPLIRPWTPSKIPGELGAYMYGGGRGAGKTTMAREVISRGEVFIKGNPMPLTDDLLADQFCRIWTKRLNFLYPHLGLWVDFLKNEEVFAARIHARRRGDKEEITALVDMKQGWSAEADDRMEEAGRILRDTLSADPRRMRIPQSVPGIGSLEGYEWREAASDHPVSMRLNRIPQREYLALVNGDWDHAPFE